MFKSIGSIGAALCAALLFAAQSFSTPAPAGPGFAGDLAVPVNKSHIVEVDAPFQRISVGNPEIADILPLTGHSFYVLGKKLGVTNVTLFGPGERVITVFDITVTYDITGLKTRISELFPSDQVEVRATADGIVLSGAV